MSVHVGDGLTCVRPGVEHETEVAVCVPRSEVLREGDEFGEQRGISCCEFDDVTVILGFGDHEQVHRRLRCDVAQREETVVLGEDLTGYLPVQDSREDRGFGHVLSLAAAAITAPGGSKRSPTAESGRQHSDRGGAGGRRAEHGISQPHSFGAGILEALQLFG